MTKNYSPLNLANLATTAIAYVVVLMPMTSLAVYAAPAATAAAKSAAPAEPSATPAVTMKPGVWETSISVEVIGVAAKRTTSAANCLSSADLKNTQRFVPPQIEAGLKCEILDYALKGDTAKWRVICSGKVGAMVGEGSIKFSAESFAGSSIIEPKAKSAKASQKSKKIQQTLTGKLQGACK